jgi:DNA-binding CsgD family transcriptional regulator
MNNCRPTNGAINQLSNSTRSGQDTAVICDGADIYHELLCEALDAVDIGIVLITAEGRVQYANGRAATLIKRGEGLKSICGRLAVVSAGGIVRLPDLLLGWRESGRTPIVLKRDAGSRPLFAHIVAPERHGASPAGAVMFIVDPEHYAVPRFEAFASFYQLTSAEARILKEIVRGKGLLAATTKLGVAESTARTHLQRIFDKTGARRQTELLCLYLSAISPADS